MKTRKVDVLISGIGPAGLAVAYEAAKLEKSVAIISKHPPGFVRVQGIFLTEPQRCYLRCMYPGFPQAEVIALQDQTFIQQSYRDLFLSIKDIERYIYRMLLLLKEKGAQIDIYYGAELCVANLEDGSAIIKLAPHKFQTIKFGDLVGADGGGRHALQTVLQQEITFIPDKFATYPFHASAYVFLQREDGQPMQLPDKKTFIPEYHNHICLLGLKKDSYQKHNGLQVKCTFVGELPQEIYSLADPAATLDYIRKVAEYSFARQGLDYKLRIRLVPASRKHGPAKDKMKFMLFTTNGIARADKAVIKAGNHHLLLVGENYRNAHYRTALGFNHALLHAQGIGAFLGGKINMAGYNLWCERLGKRAEAVLLSSHINFKLAEAEEQLEKQRKELSAKVPRRNTI